MAFLKKIETPIYQAIIITGPLIERDSLNFLLIKIISKTGLLISEYIHMAVLVHS